MRALLLILVLLFVPARIAYPGSWFFVKTAASSFSQPTKSIYLNHATTFQAVDWGATLSGISRDPTAGSFTLIQWIKPMSTGDYQSLFSMVNGGGFRGFESRMEPGGYWYIGFRGNGGSLGKVTQSGLSGSTWHQLCYTHAGTNSPSSMTLYVDGSSVSTNAADGSSWATLPSAGTWNLAARNIDGSGNTYKVVHTAIYDIALSSGEVSATISGGKPADLLSLSTAANLKHWWYLADGDDLTTSNGVIDHGPGAVNGTGVNGIDNTFFSADVP